LSDLFIVTLVLLAAVAYRIFRKQQELNSYRAERELYPSQPRSLFDQTPDAAEARRLSAAPAATEPSHDREEFRLTLLARAAAGDLTALADAHRDGNPALYRSALAEALDWAKDSEENLQTLASFIASDAGKLRGSGELARAYLKIWEQSPDRATTARLLHLAALSDDADTFGDAVGATASALREGRLASLTGEELRALAESEFWVLSSESRTTGAGFVLKQRLASLRQELAP
jgi:hypothetical protein